MVTDSEFIELPGSQPGNNSMSAGDEEMAMLLDLESPAAPQPGEEIFVPNLEHLLMPRPNAINYGSSERSIAEVVYAFGHTAALLAHQVKLLTYSPSRDRDFDPFAPFNPPSMKDAIDAVRTATRLQNGRIRINAMGGHVLNLVLAYGAAPDIRMYDQYTYVGAGEYTLGNIDAINASREAYEQVLAEVANAQSVPHQAGEASGLFLNDEPAAAHEELSPQELRAKILAAYEDGVGCYDAKTRKVDFKQFRAALRLVAIQNVVAARLDSLGKLPEDAKLYSLEEAEQLLGAPEFDKRRGVIELVGSVKFNPRANLYPIAGKTSLDTLFKAPGLTGNAVQAALVLQAETEQALVAHPGRTTSEPVMGAEVTPEVVSPVVNDTTEASALPTVQSYDVARLRFANHLAGLLGGTLPDDETMRTMYEAVTSFDPSRELGVVIALYQYSDTLGRAEAFDWVAKMRQEIPAWPRSRQQRQQRQGTAQDHASQGTPVFAARRSAQSRGSSPRAEPRRRSNR